MWPRGHRCGPGATVKNKVKNKIKKKKKQKKKKKMFFISKSFRRQTLGLLLMACVCFFLTKQKSYSHDCLRPFENKKKKKVKKKKKTLSAE